MGSKGGQHGRGALHRRRVHCRQRQQKQQGTLTVSLCPFSLSDYLGGWHSPPSPSALEPSAVPRATQRHTVWVQPFLRKRRVLTPLWHLGCFYFWISRTVCSQRWLTHPHSGPSVQFWGMFPEQSRWVTWQSRGTPKVCRSSGAPLLTPHSSAQVPVSPRAHQVDLDFPDDDWLFILLSVNTQTILTKPNFFVSYAFCVLSKISLHDPRS